MNGIEEEEAPTTSMKMVPLVLILMNSLIEEEFSDDSSARIRMHIIFVLPSSL